MRPITNTAKWIAMFGIAIGAVACQHTANGAKQDTAEAQQELREKTADARQELREETAEAKRDIAEARKDAAETVADAKRETAETTAEARQKAGDAADKTGNAITRAADDVGDAAKTAAKETGNAVKKAGSATEGAIKTADVKTALMADKRVDASDINVDTDHATKTVTLKGRVPTAAQKATAEQIAVKQATGYHVVNRLVVKS